MTFNFLSICSVFGPISCRNMDHIYKERKGINCNLYLFCPLVFIDCTKACPGLIAFRLTQSDWRFVFACRQHLSSLNSHLISQLKWLMRHSWMFYSICKSCPRRHVRFVWYECLLKFSSSWHVILTNAPLLVSELINKQKSGRVKVQICIGIRLIWGLKQLSVRRWFHFSLGDKGAINYRNHSEFIPSPCLRSPSRYWLEAKWRHSIMGNWVWLTYAVWDWRAPQGRHVDNSDDVTIKYCIWDLWPVQNIDQTHTAWLQRFTEAKGWAVEGLKMWTGSGHQVWSDTVNELNTNSRLVTLWCCSIIFNQFLFYIYYRE